MTDRQNNKLASYAATETVLDEHADALAPIPAAVRAADDFRTLLTELRDAIRDQSDYAPEGEAKQALRDALTKAAVPVAQAVAAWAEEEGDVTLADQLDLTKRDFSHSREQDALDLAALVHDKATEHAAALADYGIAPDTLTDLDAHITAFADALSAPRHAIAERKAPTEAIERLFPQIDRVLTRRLDRLVEQTAGTPFYSEYKTAREIVDR